MYILLWFVLMVVFLLVEASTVVMVSLWFAAGSLAALIASLLGAGLWLQILLFFLVSAALLAALRPVAKKHFTPRIQRTNVDALIGSQGYVLEEINNLTATGKVKLGAMEWTARSTANHPIPAGTLVTVDKIEGVKVYVSPAEITAPV